MPEQELIALCVDGPMRGRLQSMPRAGWQMAVCGAAHLRVAVYGDVPEELELITYRPYRLQLVGRMVWIASIRPAAIQIQEQDLVATLLSPAAQQLCTEDPAAAPSARPFSVGYDVDASRGAGDRGDPARGLPPDPGPRWVRGLKVGVLARDAQEAAFLAGWLVGGVPRPIENVTVTEKEAICPMGKVRFRDELGAKMALARLSVKQGDQPIRVYRCPLCRGGWHSTSQKKR